MNKKSTKKKDFEGVNNEQRIKELQLQLKKALSDYQNLKRDMDKRLDFEEIMIRKGVIRNLVELADDIDLAMENEGEIPQSGTGDKGWREGVSNILNKFYTVLKDLGGQIMEVKKGDDFDSEKHEAIGMVTEGEDGKIVKVVQNGYILNDIIVRPARVIVSKSEKSNK